MALRKGFRRRRVLVFTLAGGRSWLSRLAASTLLALITFAVLWYTPTAYYVVAPGAAYNTAPMVSVTGGKGDRRGELLMLAVTTRDANLFWFLYSQFDRRSELQNRQDFLGGYTDFAEYLRHSQAMMEDSQATAKVVALRAAGYDARVEEQGVEVTALRPGSPAEGLLQKGDLIVAADGQPTLNITALLSQLARRQPGDRVDLMVRRQGELVRLQVPTGANPDRPGQAAFFVNVQNARPRFSIPVTVEIKAGEISGPSAGLMFSLEILDQLLPEDLSGGLKVAGTGTIEADGRVGAIGGVVQKVYTAEAAGAELMLVPKDNYEAARRVARRIKVVPVGTLNDAIQALRQTARTGR